jgi:hypothetical protein
MDPVTAGGFQVSERGSKQGTRGAKRISKGNEQGEMRKARGIRQVYCNLCSYIMNV